MVKETNDKILKEREQLKIEKDEFMKIKQDIISKLFLSQKINLLKFRRERSHD